MRLREILAVGVMVALGCHKGPDPKRLGVFADTDRGLIELAYGEQTTLGLDYYSVPETEVPRMSEVHALFMNIPEASISNSKLLWIEEMGDQFRERYASPLRVETESVEGSMYRLNLPKLPDKTGVLVLKVPMPLGAPNRIYPLGVGRPENLAKQIPWDPEKPPGWTFLKAGESKAEFTLTKDGFTELRGKALAHCNYQQHELEDWELAISPLSPNEGLRILVCWEAYRGGVDAHIIRSQDGGVVASSIIPSRWRIAKWVSWSPDEEYALIFPIGEVTMGDMAFVDLQSGRPTEVHFTNFTRGYTQLQDFEVENIKWLSPNAFKVRLDVHCNPYELGEECNRNQVLETHSAYVTMKPFEIDYQ